MHPLPRRVLRQLIADYGKEALLNEPARVDALLADLCGEYPRERFLLVHALRVLDSVAQLSGMHWLESYARELQSRYCFSAEAAQWAVESWSAALDIAPTVTNHIDKEIHDDSHAKLSEIPQRTLYQLLSDWGPDLLNDPRRVDALLADLCYQDRKEARNERFLLFHALRERIPTQLILAHALRVHIPTQLLLVHAPRERALAAHLIHPHGNAIYANWLSQRLQNRYGFSAEAAQWVVEGCSIAVNVASPVQELATAGTPLSFLDEIMLRILQHDARAKAWVSAEVLARQKAKEHDEAIAAARQKAEEREAAEEAVRQKAKEKNEAVAVARQKAKEREAAEEAVRQKAKEQNEAVAAARQKNKEREAAEEAVRQKAKEQNEAVAAARQKNKERKATEEAVHQKAEKQKAEKAVSLERAKETIAAQEAALTKATEWIATKAADHQKAKEWGAAEEAVLQKADEWVATRAADHQKVAGWSAAKAVDLEKAKVWVSAEKAVLQRTEELVATKAADHQKTVEWDEAEAAVLQRIREWVAAKTAARHKMFEWAAADKAAHVKAEERSAADKYASVKAEERSAADKYARVKTEELSAAEKAARVIALEEITFQILKKTPLTSREVAAFLDHEHEHAVSWLRQLQAAGKVEYVWLKRSPHHPCYQIIGHPNALPPDQDNFPFHHIGWRWLAILAATLLLTGIWTAPGMMKGVIPQLPAQAPIAWQNLTSWIDDLFSPPEENGAPSGELEKPTSGVAEPESNPSPEQPTATQTRLPPTITPILRNPPRVTISRSRMNVRRGPATPHAIIGVADIGEEFPIIGKNMSGDWWQIVYRGNKAWIYAPYVTATNARIVKIVPTPTPLPSTTPTPTPPGNNSNSRGQRAVIVYVVDGDTVDVQFEAGDPDRIRLFDINTPEIYRGVECFGRQATAFTTAFTGQEVAVESRGRDRYERLLAYIWLADGRMLNEELARQGFAEYNDYGNPGKYAARIRVATDQAKRLGLGMWSQCTNGAAVPSATPGVLPTPRYPPNGPDRDCGDFDTHAEAQAFFLAAGGPGQDRHRLDGDNDGSACESLP